MSTTRRAILAALALLLVLPVPLFAAPSDWTLLGKKTVGLRTDRDEIVVGASEGGFRRIRLAVHDRGVEFFKVRVVFGNGDDYEVEMRSFVPAGQQTRVIDLPGHTRVIRKIVLWYKTRPGTARLRLPR